MKKFLSLVLALVMTMSLVTVSAGAKDFTDSDKITYKEAVDVLSAVDVIDGYADGDFRPTATLTRGAAAKIICNLILGPTAASALVADAAPYSDVPTSNTFAGYIAYCQKTGIISGYADGTFRPGNTLTGYAFMKMLLGALGYDAAVEGYTGDNWSINVAKRAINIGLTDSLVGDFNGIKAVTREEACLYAFNTLKATMVEYDTVITVGDITIAGSKANDVANKASGETIEDDNLMQFAEKYFPKLTQTGTQADAFMRPAHEWKYKKTVIGTYTDTPDAVYTTGVKGKTIYSDLGKDYDFEDYDDMEAYFVDGKQTSAGSFAVAKGNNEKIGGNGVLVEVFVRDGGDDDDTVRIVVINTFVAVADDDYDEDDETLSISVRNTDYNIASETLSSDDFDGLDSFKEDDVVLVTMAYDEDNDDDDTYVIQSIELAETTTAKVTNFDSDYNDAKQFEGDESSVTAGGTKYGYDANFDALCDFEGEYEINEEAVFYFDNYGYVISVDEVSVDAQYVYVDSFEASGISSKATVSGYGYYVDGSDKKFAINEIEGEKIRGIESLEMALMGDMGVVFTYTEKNNGSYDLDIYTTAESLLAYAFGTDDDVVAGTEATLEPADIVDMLDVRTTKETVFIVIDGDDEATVYTGIKNLPTIELVAPAYVAEDDEWQDADGHELKNYDHPKYAVVTDDAERYAEYVFIDLSNDDYATSEGASTKGSEIFLFEGTYDKKGKDADKNIYYQYNAVVNGKVTTVKFGDYTSNGLTFNALEAGLYTDVKLDADGYVKSCKLVTNDYETALDDEKNYSHDDYTEADYVKLVKDGDVITFVVDDADSLGFYLNDDYKVIVVHGEEIKNYSLNKIADKYSVENVWTIMDDDQEITTLFLDVTVYTPGD